MNVYEVVKSKDMIDEWRVEMVDSEGEIEVTLFTGPRPEERAKEYADHMGCVYE